MEKMGEWSVHELNQWIRGHNYMWCDFLMTWKYHSADSIEMTLKYFTTHINFLCQYLHHLNQHLPRVPSTSISSSKSWNHPKTPTKPPPMPCFGHSTKSSTQPTSYLGAMRGCKCSSERAAT